MGLAELKRKAQVATNRLQKVANQLEEIQALIKVQGMSIHDVTVGVNGDFELNFIYQGIALPIREAVEIMEVQGYLTPDDFR